ncbi:MAG: hypothetical protein GWP02_08730, partial [Desulfobulbaceae bacterium]|nr:hypothetical protein [Desulfobulbaceae bacterium]
MTLRLAEFLLMVTAVAAFETVTLTGDGFSFLGTPVLSNTGTVAFYGQVDDNAARGIWSGLPGDLAIVARDGSRAPDIDDSEFEGFFDP